jgi:hypothetical protein
MVGLKVWLKAAGDLMQFLIFFLVFAEGMARLLLPVSDLPVSAGDSELGIRFQPDQTGTWIQGGTGELRGNYHINGQGWNSLHEYNLDKPADTLRIVLIGDSFAEALRVDVDKTVSAALENALTSTPGCGRRKNIEVYSLGYSGASLAQYLNMMRYAMRYQPDIFVVMANANNFSTSLIDPYPHFLHYRQTSSGDFEEVPPIPYEPSPLKRLLLNSAVVRYLYLNLRIDLKLASFAATPDPLAPILAVQARQAVTLQRFPPAIESLTPLIFEQYQVAADRAHSDLLITYAPLIDVVSQTPSPPDQDAAGLLTEAAAHQTGIAFIDLFTAFVEARQHDPHWLTYPIDGHWTTWGSEIAASPIAHWIMERYCTP